MTTFPPLSFDSSGCVRLLAKDAPWKGLPKPDIYWEDLSPFVQGYVEALFAEWNRAQEQADAGLGCWGFRHLSHDALALIRKDCERFQSHYPMKPFPEYRRARGRAFWEQRQSGKRPSDFAPVYFPPVAITLNDDGKVSLTPKDK